MSKKVVFLTNPIHPAIHAELETIAQVEVARSTSARDLIEGAESASIIVVRHPLPPELFPMRLNLLVRSGMERVWT